MQNLISTKRVNLTFFFTLFILSIPFAQNVLTEDFIFPPVDSLENSGMWNRSGLNTNYNIKVVEPGLDFFNYVGSGRGNSSLISNFGDGDIVYRNFDKAIDSGSVYMSFMLRLDSLPVSFSQGYCISFNPSTGGTNLNTALYIKKLSGSSFNLGVRKSNVIEYSNLVYQINRTYLVVLKYSILPGVNDDLSSLYVFENGVPGVEPNTPLVSTIDGNDFTGQASVYLNNNYAQSGLKGCKIKVDGIRVGTSWETSVLAKLTSVSSVTPDSKISLESSPNPFRDMANINYQIPSKGLVKINVYNSFGKNCTTLFNGIQEEGSHKVIWNATGFPSGNYFYELQFNGEGISKKLLRLE